MRNASGRKTHRRKTVGNAPEDDAQLADLQHTVASALGAQSAAMATVFEKMKGALLSEYPKAARRVRLAHRRPEPFCEFIAKLQLLAVKSPAAGTRPKR